MCFWHTQKPCLCLQETTLPPAPEAQFSCLNSPYSHYYAGTKPRQSVATGAHPLDSGGSLRQKSMKCQPPFCSTVRSSRSTCPRSAVAGWDFLSLSHPNRKKIISQKKQQRVPGAFLPHFLCIKTGVLWIPQVASTGSHGLSKPGQGCTFTNLTVCVSVLVCLLVKGLVWLRAAQDTLSPPQFFSQLHTVRARALETWKQTTSESPLYPTPPAASLHLS